MPVAVHELVFGIVKHTGIDLSILSFWMTRRPCPQGNDLCISSRQEKRPPEKKDDTYPFLPPVVLDGGMITAAQKSDGDDFGKWGRRRRTTKKTAATGGNHKPRITRGTAREARTQNKQKQ
jgi:hypothetical protein